LTSIARAGHDRRPCSSVQIVRVDGVWPLFALSNQPGADWILTNVFKLFRQALIVPQSMVEKIPLLIDLRHSCSDAFKIPDEIGKLGVARNANQHVQVIWHQQK
jgi:hypothetical protein